MQMILILTLALLTGLPLAAQDATTTIKFRFYKDSVRQVTKSGPTYTFRCDGEALDAEIMEPAMPGDLGVDEFSLTNPEKTFQVTLYRDRTYLAEITNTAGVKQQCLKGDLKTVIAVVPYEDLVIGDTGGGPMKMFEVGDHVWRESYSTRAGFGWITRSE